MSNLICRPEGLVKFLLTTRSLNEIKYLEDDLQ